MVVHLFPLPDGLSMGWEQDITQGTRTVAKPSLFATMHAHIWSRVRCYAIVWLECVHWATFDLLWLCRLYGMKANIFHSNLTHFRFSDMHTFVRGQMSAHKQRYKNAGLDSSEMRRRREEEGIQLRKQKREQQLIKRRNVDNYHLDNDEDELGAVCVIVYSGLAYIFFIRMKSFHFHTNSGPMH